MSEFFQTLGGILINPQFYYSVILMTAPIIFATMGCAVAQKAGSTNLGMEGIMLISALTAVLVSAYTKSIWLGFAAGLVIGVFMGLFIAYFALKLRVDIILVGIAVNLIGSGSTVFAMYVFTGDRATTTSLLSGYLPRLDIPLIRNIPFLGEMISNQNILTYLAYISVFVLAFMLYKTRLGLRIRAVGESPNAASSVGVSVIKTKTTALLISGLFGGLGGVFMSMAYLSYFSKGMTGGRGFIALAVCAMGNANPVPCMLTSMLFGLFYALSTYARTLSIPDQIVTMLPYIATIVGLVIYSAREKAKKNKSINKKD